MSKNFLTYLPYCLVPALLLATFSYWHNLKTGDSTLSSQAQTHLNALTVELDRRLQERETELTIISLQPGVFELMQTSGTGLDHYMEVSRSTVSNSRAYLSLLPMLKGDGKFERAGLFSIRREELFHVERDRTSQGLQSFVTKSSGMTVESVPELGSRSAAVSLKGSTLQYVIFVHGPSNNAQAGILVAELNLNEAIGNVSNILTTSTSSNSSSNTFVAAVDPTARFVYSSEHNLEGALVSSALPDFLPIADAVTKNKSDVSRFQISGSQDYVTAYAPLPRWKIGLAVGHDRSSVAASAHRSGAIGILMALFAGAVAALTLNYILQKRSHGIERVEEGLTAIAKGDLDQRIDLKSSDDARAIADSINAMAEKMRAQIAKEEETKQFQMFVRLSAMLTHDLKNAIEALSLIVGNMERHFDNEEFRRDALKSLTSATEKLKGIVARLTRPLTSLSGEHPRPKSVDLVPMMRKVVAMTAEPLREKHRIEVNLPPNLFVYTDPDRIEKVIENLIINALEAMADKNGKLVIEAGLTTRGAATFAITDTGPGMSPEFIDQKLFRPFSTTKKQGVGLGLYTCREVIEASAGSIEVESVEGAGTTFRVVLPSASHDSRY